MDAASSNCRESSLTHSAYSVPFQEENKIGRADRIACGPPVPPDHRVILPVTVTATWQGEGRTLLRCKWPRTLLYLRIPRYRTTDFRRRYLISASGSPAFAPQVNDRFIGIVGTYESISRYLFGAQEICHGSKKRPLHSVKSTCWRILVEHVFLIPHPPVKINYIQCQLKLYNKIIY